MPEWLRHPATIVIGIGALTSAVVKISLWAGSVNADLQSLKDSVGEIRKTVEKILSQLSPRATVTSASPLRLTDLGREILDRLDGKTWAMGMAPGLLDRVRGMDPYRVQEFCRAYVQDGTNEGWVPDEEMSAKLGYCAFEHGLKIEQVLDVLAIELRDVLLRLLGDQLPPLRMPLDD